jgi:hypothetical protein
MTDLFDAAPMYDEDYLYFFAAPGVIRGGRTRRVNFVKRLFGFPELRDWLLSVGFTAVRGYGEDGRPLTAGHKRMVIVAGLP